MGLFPKSLSQYIALSGIPQSKGSKVFIVDAVNGSDSNPGTTWEAPLATVSAAYALCTTLKNDVVLLVGNGTSNAATAAITWAKDFTHLIGLSAPGLMEPRSRITSPAALATTPFVTWSGDGCIVKNISFWHSSSNAASLVNVTVSGHRNYFENVQFAGQAGANAVTGARALVVTGADGGNTFQNCYIGLDTIMSVDGMGGVQFLVGSMHNQFNDCVFATSTNGTTYAHAVIAAAADIGRMNIFRRCLFVNQGNGVQAEVFKIGAALGAERRPFLLDCWEYGATEWETTNNGLVTNVTIAANTTGVATGNILKITS